MNLRGNSQEIFSSQGWKNILQKTEAKNFCGARSSAIPYQGLWSLHFQLNRGKHLAGHSQSRLPEGRVLTALLQDHGVWLQGPAVLDLPLPKDAFGLPLVIEVCRGFLTCASQFPVRFFCFNNVKLPWF